MDLGLTGMRALVTGASLGLGRAVAASLRAEGAQVALCARDAQRVRTAAQDLGAVGFVHDLAVSGAHASLVRQAEAAFGGIDILVANTGGPPAGDFQAVDDAAWRLHSTTCS